MKACDVLSIETMLDLYLRKIFERNVRPVLRFDLVINTDHVRHLRHT